MIPVAAQDEPVRGFVNLQPFEIKVQALCKPAAFRTEWGLNGPVIDDAARERVLSQALELLKTKTAVKSQDMGFNFNLTSARFLKLNKELGYVNDERDEIPIDDAIIGVSISSVAEGISRLDIAWLFRAPGQTRVPVQLSAGSERMARFLTDASPILRWTGEITAPPKLAPLPPIKMIRRDNQPVLLRVGLGILGLTGLIVLIFKTRTPPLIFFLIPLGLVALFGAFRFAKSVPVLPDKEEANDLVESLLRNTYHAFDFRDESDIYDTLEYTISGQALLESVYLEVLEGLELENRGGPKVRIKAVAIRQSDVIAKNDDAGTFDVQSEWVAVGDVNHWGHTHIRNNRYEAVLRVAAKNDTWKITKMQILDEEREQITTPAGGAVQ